MNENEAVKIAILEEKIRAGAETLRLQAGEYERRLSDLNHEAERLRSMQETYVNQSLYQTQYKYLTEKIDSVMKIVYIGLGIILTLQIYFKIRGG